MTTDRELLEAWRSGSAAAGEALFERHFDAVMRFFRNKIDDGPEELVQRTFLACVEGRTRFRGDSTFRTYLFAVAHNTLKAHFRSRRRRGVEIDFTAESVWGLAPSPSTLAVRDRSQRVLLDALRRIPVQSQVVLELHYWEGLTAAEIGEVIDVPHGTAKTRIRRARQLLGAAIEERARGESLDVSQLDLDAWAQSVRQVLLR
ncbi:MAG: RNA polymerase sigma factor [Myxococcota bacterium]